MFIFRVHIKNVFMNRRMYYHDKVPFRNSFQQTSLYATVLPGVVYIILYLHLAFVSLSHSLQSNPINYYDYL